jgi:AcrR family transcriptional regulator
VKADKQDRRSKRTQKLLGKALNSLMLERRYCDLTVQDILDEANVGRSTFYTHFWDKDDLLESQIEQLLEALTFHIHDAPTANARLFPSLGLFQHIQEQQRFYQALVRGQGIELVLRTLRLQLCEYVERRLRSLNPSSGPSIAITVTAQAIVGTLLALLQWWMETEVTLSAEQIDAYYHQLIMPGVREMMGI